jgi:hypothetical protein
VHTGLHHVAGVLAVEPVEGAAAYQIELDALDDVARLGLLRFRVIKVVGLECLELQRNRKSIAFAPLPEAHQALAALEYRARNQRLKAVEIKLAVGVALLDPFSPGGVDQAVQVRFAASRLRRDARADGVAHHPGNGARRVGVIADQVA